MDWINAKIRLPRVSRKEPFILKNNHSDKVLVWENGECRFGYYVYDIETWVVEGRGGQICVTHWAYIKKP